MKAHRLTGVWLVSLLIGAGGSVRAAQPQSTSAVDAAPDSSPLFRIFLKDGSSLVSFGEPARLDDHVVFSMPTSASLATPQLQLVTIPSDRVDWERTLNYADTLRAARYLATRADADYALLTTEIAQALNDVGSSVDPIRRLAIVERARKTLAEWPAAHYNYKRDEIQQMLGTLDEAIASLRAEIGSSTFDLTFVAPGISAAPADAILPAPSARDVIEQTMRAADLTASPAERVSLLTVAANALEAEAPTLPSAFLVSARATVAARMAAELEADRKYQALTARTLRLATLRARAGDVRGVQRVLSGIGAEDQRLGGARPDAVASLVAAVEAQLDAARHLRLERDRWALRGPEIRAYRAAIAVPLDLLGRLTPLLDDIKSLSGTGPDAIGSILRTTARIQKALSTITPPSEARDAHNLLVSAVQLADSAAKIRREAAIDGNMPRAWDASSAAAGALMLAARARTDLQAALRPPQGPR